MKKNKNVTVILGIMAAVALYFYMKRKKSTTAETAQTLPEIMPVNELAPGMPTQAVRPMPPAGTAAETESPLEIAELDFYESEQPTEPEDFDIE